MRRSIPIWVLLVFSGIIFLYLPLLLTLFRAVNIETLTQVFRGGYLGILQKTIVQALWSTLLAFSLGFPAAYIVVHSRSLGSRMLSVLSILPFVMPTILLVLGFVLVWGNNGMVNRIRALLVPSSSVIPFLYRMEAIVVIHGVYNFGIFVRVLSAHWIRIDQRQIETAQLLGATKWQRFRDVVLPQLTQALFISCLLVFLFCFTSFGVIMIVGGGPQHATLEVSLYYLLKGTVNEDLARGVALLQFLSTLCIACLLLGSRHAGIWKSRELREVPKKRIPSFSSRLLSGAYYFVLCILLVLPLLYIAVFAWGGRSLLSDFSLRSSGISFLRTIVTSGAVAIGSALLSVSLGLICGGMLQQKKKLLTFIFALLTILPLCVSPLIISMSYRDTFRRIGMGHTSLFSVVFVHAILALPIVVGIILNTFRNISSHVLDAARMLGASAYKRFFTVLLPLSLNGIAAAAVFALALSLGELNAALLLAPPNFVTIPVAIYTLLGRYRVHHAAQLGVYLLGLTGFLIYGLDVLIRRRQGRRYDTV